MFMCWNLGIEKCILLEGLEVVLQVWCILDLGNLKVGSGFKLYISCMAKCVQWDSANTVQTAKGHDNMLKCPGILLGPRLSEKI